MDRWEQNPEILMMRQVFRQLEAAHDELMAKLKISVFDQRLPVWRQRARVLFEKLWYQHVKPTGNGGETQAGVVYTHCLARVMRDAGIRVQGSFLPAGDVFERFFQEELR